MTSHQGAEIFDELPDQADETPSADAVAQETKSSVEISARSRFHNAAFASAAIIAVIAIVFGFIALNINQRAAIESQRRIVLGNSAMIDGDMDQALYNYTRALEINPRAKGAHAALGRIALARGRGEDAAGHFEAELQLNPRDMESHLALGCLNAIACVADPDTRSLRPYLLSHFVDVLPAEWAKSLDFTPSYSADPLAKSVYHFQAAMEQNPGDPPPQLGLAFTHLANYNLDAARQKLSRMLTSVDDEVILAVVKTVLSDINNEEVYLASLPREKPLEPETPGSGEPSTAPSEPVVLPSVPDDLTELPPINVGEVDTSNRDNSAFGSGFGSPQLPREENDLTLLLTESDLVPQPSVKPINNDFYLQESKEWVRSVRIANIQQPGSVGFREGETIVMPHTNAEITVVESGEDRIVIKEGENTFTWIPGDVGWMLQPAPSEPLDITATLPDESSETSDETQSELGPEILN